MGGISFVRSDILTEGKNSHYDVTIFLKKNVSMSGMSHLSMVPVLV